MIFQLPIGDWSCDGHEEAVTYRVSAEKTIEAVRDAYFRAVAMFAVTPETFCADYEDAKVPTHVIEFFVQHKVPFSTFSPEEPEDFDAGSMAEFVVWFINQGDPEVRCELLPDDDAPMLQFYGRDDADRHIGSFGYGLFLLIGPGRVRSEESHAMNNHSAGIARVPMEECKRRALEFGQQQAEPLPASSFAEAIWPGHRMKGQGAGVAAARVLSELEKEGRAGWRSIGAGAFQRWGWWAR